MNHINQHSSPISNPNFYEMITSTTRHKKPPISNPNFSNHSSPQTPTSSPSTSTITSILSNIEPPPYFFPSKSDFLKLIFVVAIASAVAAFLSAALNRPPKPFCDSTTLDDFDFSFSDSCEPCPSNGRCYNGELECNQGFRKYGKVCIEDGVIYEIAKKLSEWTKNRLCKECAESMCNGTGAVWVSENSLKNMLDESGVAQGFAADDVNYLFVLERAMEDINEFLETRTTENGIKEFRCPNTLAETYRSMACCVQQWIARNFLALLTMFSVLAGCFLSLIRIRNKSYLKKRAEQLYHQVCDILEDNAFVFKNSNDREPWLVASRLRDHLLSTKERRDPLLWKTVEELVESDSRIDRYPKIVKGEMKVVWEWQVEGSLSSSRRRKLETSHPNSGAEMKNSSDKKQRSVEIALDYNELHLMS